MLIRSQDKTALLKFENIVINLKLPDSLNIICWSLQDSQRNGGYFILGKYSTKEKSMKVLDMIQEAYYEFMAVRNDDMWNGKESVFQMPEDVRWKNEKI